MLCPAFRSSLTTKKITECKSARLDTPPWKREAAGSNPATQTSFALLPQLVEGAALEADQSQFESEGGYQVTRAVSLNGKAPGCNPVSVAARGGSNPSPPTKFLTRKET